MKRLLLAMAALGLAAAACAVEPLEDPGIGTGSLLSRPQDFLRPFSADLKLQPLLLL